MHSTKRVGARKFQADAGIVHRLPPQGPSASAGSQVGTKILEWSCNSWSFAWSLPAGTPELFAGSMHIFLRQVGDVLNNSRPAPGCS